jgi:hypothetical protein
MSGYQPQGYDPRQQRPATPQQWQQSQQQDAPWERYGPAQEQWEQPARRNGQPQHAPQQAVRERHERSPGFLYAGIALVVGIVIGGVAGYVLHSSPAAANAGSATAGATATGSAPVAPDTSAAAKSAAAQFFALYSAGQWAPAWQYLTAADKAEAPLSVYTAVHQGCPSEAAGLAYAIKEVTMAGKTAVITYSLSGVAAAIGSGTMAETWTAAGWTVNPDDMSIYSHGSAAADIAAAKAKGSCAG